MDGAGLESRLGCSSLRGGRGLDFATPSPSPILIHGVGNFFAKSG